MMMTLPRLVPAFVFAVVSLVSMVHVLAQEPMHDEPRGRRRAELARLFDEYALSQAREELGLDQAQFERFSPKFSALQALRRQSLGARRTQLRELARLVGQTPPASEEVLGARLDAIDEEDRRARDEIRRAEDALDEVLTVAQRARLRLFDEELERKKLELMMRVRRAPRRESMR
jgi:hypothetical protein